MELVPEEDIDKMDAEYKEIYRLLVSLQVTGSIATGLIKKFGTIEKAETKLDELIAHAGAKGKSGTKQAMTNFVARCTNGYCFIAGTLIAEKNGLKPIEKIKENDWVHSWDFDKKVTTLQRVVRTFQRTTTQLVHLFIGKDTIHTTPEHPFYSGTAWIKAADLRKGAKVFLFSTLLTTVDSTFTQDTTCTVYNFEVERTHNYYVGKEGVLVHNTCRVITSKDGTIKLYNKGGNLVNVKNYGMTDGYHSSGIYFDKNAFPDMRPITLGQTQGKPVFAKFDKFELTGKDADFTKARKWLKGNETRILSDVNASKIEANGSVVTVMLQNGTEVKYTWHHHQDTQTLMLVEQKAHNLTGHSGGRHVIEHNEYILKNKLADSEGFVFYLSPY